MGKGSGGQMPPQQTAMEQAQAQDWLAQQEYNRNQTQKAADDAAKKAAEDAQKKQTTADINAQYTAGQTYGANQLKSLGYADTYGIMDAYNTALNAAKASVPATATDVAKYFTPSTYWTNAINQATNTQRGKLNTAYGNLTKPGWQQTYVPDTMDDAILKSILGEQETTAQGQLLSNLQRGTMSQGAYDYAMNQINNQAEAGMSNLQTIGGGVLGKYRDTLTGTANQYGDRVTNYQLGQNVNLDDLSKSLTSQTAGFGTSMKGDILKALGDTKLFDIASLVTQAGNATGASNTPLQTAFTNQPAVVDPNRTTGTTGTF